MSKSLEPEDVFGARESAGRQPAEQGGELSLQKGCLIPGAPGGLSRSVAVPSALKGDMWEAAGWEKQSQQAYRSQQLYGSSKFNCVAQLQSDTFLHALINTGIQVYLGHTKG